MDYKKNQNYFEPVSYKGPIWMIVIGAIFTFFIAFPLIGNKSGGAGAFFLLVGLALLGGGIALIVFKKKGIISDAEYDASIAPMLQGMQGKALNKLGIDADEVKEIDPITIDGFKFKTATRFKRGADGLWRTNMYETVILFFSANEVHCYHYLLNTLNGAVTEATEVYFYRDIVSVATASDTYQNGGTTINYEYFKLQPSGGDPLTVDVRDSGGVQRSINAMRQLLRAKKSY